MAEQNAPASFESGLENDLARLAAEVKQQRERPDLQGSPEQAIIREAIRAFPEAQGRAREAAGAQVSVPAPRGSGNDPASPLPAYAQSAPAETKLEIEYLISQAFREGIGKALEASKKSPYFVQDAFHDALAGRLYPELQRRGLINK